MQAKEMLERCSALEQRAAALYRRFATDSAADDRLRALWLRLAEEEDDHAAAVRRASAAAAVRGESRIDGWTEAVVQAERVLAAAEAAPPATPDDRLMVALDLERNEIDTLRETLLALAGQLDSSTASTRRHAAELADVATRCSSDPRVLLKASLVQVHDRLSRETTAR